MQTPSAGIPGLLFKGRFEYMGIVRGIVRRLELLAHYEVELASALAALTCRRVEAVTPVDTQHTHHRQIETYAETG